MLKKSRTSLFLLSALFLCLQVSKQAAHASCPVPNEGEFFMKYDPSTNIMNACEFGEALSNVCGSESVACSDDGQIEYDFSGREVMRYCNGSNWIEIDCYVGASCAGTAEGTIALNAGSLSYCDGTDWQAFYSDEICSGIGVLEGLFTPDADTKGDIAIEFGFRNTIAMTDDYMIVGAFNAAVSEYRDGAAAIYKRSGASWSHLVNLSRSYNDEDMYFGNFVDMEGDYAVVGAYGVNDVFLYQKDEGGADNWGEIKRFNGSGGDYGRSVTIDDDMLIVGAIDYDDTFLDEGRAFVYRKDFGGSDNWGEVAILEVPEGPIADNDFFGFNSSVSGDVIAVSAAHRADNGISNSGAVYLFKETSSDTWTFLTKIINPNGQDTNDYFGFSVDIKDSDDNGTADLLAISAYGDDDAGSNAGMVAIYERDEGGADNWGRVTTIYGPATTQQIGHNIELSDNDRLIVSHFLDDTNASNAGEVFVFQKDQGGADNWGLEQSLTPADASANDYFGYGVAMSDTGDYLAAGAPHAGNGAGDPIGKAYVYNRSGTTWSSQGFVQPHSSFIFGERMGETISVSGNYVAVAHTYKTNFYESNTQDFMGGVNIYKKSSSGTWSLDKAILPESRSNQMKFGEMVDIWGDYLAVSAPADNSGASDAGAVQIFERNLGGANNWGYVKEIKMSDAEEDDAAGNGRGLAIFGEYIAVGASGEDGTLLSGGNAGAVYIFKKDEGGTDNWGEIKKITPPAEEASALFGFSLDIMDDLLVVGAYQESGGGTERGGIYFYGKDEGGTDNWGYLGVTHKGEANGDDYGFSVSLSDSRLAVAAPANDATNSNTGAVYIYEEDEGGAGTWGLVKKILHPSDASTGYLGYSLSLAGDIVIAGAPYEDINGTNTGRAYVFSKDEGGVDNWGLIETIEPNAPEAGERFGFAVGATTDKVVVTAQSSNLAGADMGAVYMFGCPSSLLSDSFEVWSAGLTEAPDNWTSSVWTASGDDCGRSTTSSNGIYAVRLATSESFQDAGHCEISRTIDLTAYSTMLIDVTSVSGASNAVIDAGGANTTLSSVQNDVSVDISGVTGSQTVTIGYTGDAADDSYVIVDNLRFE